MEVEFPCGSCHNLLRVTAAATGRRARCPHCGSQFTVPASQQLMEDKVSGWIEHDVEEVREDREHRKEEQLAPNEQAAAAPSESAAVSVAGGTAVPSTESASDPDDSDSSPLKAGTDTSDLDVELLPAEQPKARVRRKSKAGGAKAKGALGGYPKRLHVDERIPHLAVRKVDAVGVTFAFDSAWLELEGFRASMPVRCVFSGNASRGQLIGRPIVFSDRSHATSAALAAAAASLENRELGDRTPRDLVRSMGQIDAIPPPFMNAMPYYVSTKYAHMSVHCRTRGRVSGGITCEVLIPDTICALEWLERVNGVCGPEYELLVRDVSMFHGDAWRDLSDECQQRISLWCRLGPHEVFQQYFNDADFGKRDEGLAGLVVTDHRVLFCKYHHREEVSLEADNTVILIKQDGQDGAFANLTLLVGNDRTRMVKLHAQDVEPLMKQLGRAEKLGVMLSDN